MSRRPFTPDLQGGSAQTAEEAAADWLMLLSEAPEDADLVRAHATWRAASPEHEAAWRRTERGWKALGNLEIWSERPDRARPGRSRAAEPGPVRRARGLWRGPFYAGPLAGGLVAGALLLLLSTLVPEALLRVRADHISAPGQLIAFDLADGSHVSLGADSALSVHFSDERRDVSLLRGTAFFEVTRDPSRPFIVTTRGVSAQALGTAFEVDRTAGEVQVAVAEGHVRVSGSASEDDLLAGAWERVTSDGAVSRGEMDPSMVAEWREDRLFAEDRSAVAVATRLQRELGGRIVLLGSARERRVTGLFDLSKPDEALETLASSLDLEIRRFGKFRVLYAAG